MHEQLVTIMDSTASTQLSREIIDSLAKSILRKEPFGEVKDMLIDTVSYRQLLCEWRDSNTGLNILQLAVSCDYIEVVRLLTNAKNESLFSDVFSNGLNHPFHLACKVGAIGSVKYFLEVTQSEEKNFIHYWMHDLLRSAHPVLYPERTPLSAPEQCEAEKKTPFGWCLHGGHLHCAKLLCTYIMKCLTTTVLRDPIKGTYLHQACYLGSPEFLSLLLHNGHASELQRKDIHGHTPYHSAVFHAQPECLEILLKCMSRSQVNSTADCKSALHLMYSSKTHPYRVVACTNLLLGHGIDVNMVDYNYNTAMDYLAWGFSKKYYDDSHLEGYIRSFLIPEPRPLPPAEHEYNIQKIIKCMELLLQAGAPTMVKTRCRRTDHTIVHTLLQNTSWPVSSFIVRHPDDLFQVLKLLFSYGANANVIARNNCESAFTMLLIHCLNEITREERKCNFVHLFIISGADLECCVAQPRNFRENYADVLWNIYPVMLALQERHPISVLRLMYNFMSLEHIARSMTLLAESYLWYRIQMRTRSSPDHVNYKAKWQRLRKELHRPRSVRHMCKLVILKQLKMPGQKVAYLPLPVALKKYLLSQEC